MDLHCESVIPFMRVSNAVRLVGLEGRKKKPGAGKNKNVRVKNGTRGGRKVPRPQHKRSRTRCVRGWAFPWESLLRGVGKTTLSPTSVRLPTRASRNVWPQNKTEWEKKKPSTRSTEHPCRLASQEKGPQSKYQENPKNARGPERHPEENARSGTHSQNGQKQVRRDIKREKEQTKKCVWGCPVTT